MAVHVERAHLQVDTSRWPLVQITCAGRASDAEWTGHLREIEQKVLGRREVFVQVIDQTRMVAPDPIQRAIIVRHQLQLEHRYREFCRGEAYVAGEDMQVVMSAVFCQARPAYPYVFVQTIDEAAQWARTRLP